MHHWLLGFCKALLSNRPEIRDLCKTSISGKKILSLTIVVEVSDDCHKYLACSGEHILRNCFSLNFCKNNIHSLSLTKVHYFSMSPISREANTKTFFTKYTLFYKLSRSDFIYLCYVKILVGIVMKGGQMWDII